METLTTVTPTGATVDCWPHPLTAEGRRVRQVTAGTTLLEVIAAELPAARSTELAVTVDGKLTVPEEWGRPIHDGALVTVRARLGEGGDSNPVAVALQIALVAASIFVPYAIGGAFALGSVGGAFLGAGILIAGGLIINSLVPPRTPDPIGNDRNDPEPVHSLSGGSNQARPYEPMPLVLGTHRLFPDLAAAEYTEVRGEEHYLYQIFNFGVGDLDIEDIRIGDTPFEKFEEVTIERSGPDGRINLVAGNVDTATGAELEDTAWVERTTAARTTRIGLDFAASLFRINEEDGSVQPQAVTVQIRWWPEGDDTNVTTHSATLRNDETTPYRRTLSYDMPGGDVYVVQVRRTSAPNDSDRVHDDVTWSALRSYQQDDGDYSGQNRLGVRIRASGQLQGRLQQLSAMVSQRVPVWDGAQWTAPRRTSNPAWLFRWFARGHFVNGRLVAGAALPDKRVDDESLKAWGSWCQREQLECNWLVRGRRSRAEVLTVISQCGRASPTWAPGKLGVVWDAADRPPTAMFGPGNIIAGSMEVEYSAGPLADEIICRYIDPDLDWQWNSVRRPVPGVNNNGSPTNSVEITLRGVTKRRQAAVECNLQAARQECHGRRIAWQAGRAGMGVTRGDVVYLTHSLLDGGLTGRLLGGADREIRLNREITVPPGFDNFVLLQLPDGELHNSAVLNEPGPTDTLELADPLPGSLTAGGSSPIDTLWRFYPGDTPPRLVRLVGMEWAGDDRVRIEAIDEKPEYYAAATANLDVPLTTSRRRPPAVLDVHVGEELIRAGAGYAVTLTAEVVVAGDWRGGVVRAAYNGGQSRTVARLVDGDTTARWIGPPSGPLVVTVTPGTETAPSGAPFKTTYEIIGKFAPPSTPGNFLLDVIADGTRRFRWTPGSEADLAGHEIRYAEAVDATFDQMLPLHKGLLTDTPYETVEPPAGAWRFGLRSVDTSGLASEPVYIVAEIGPSRLGDFLLWTCPSANGWPGTITGAIRSSDGRDTLEGVPDYTWADLTSWAAWESWGRGPAGAAGAGRSISFETLAIDLGAAFNVSLSWNGEVVGTPTFEYRAAATEAALADAAWVEYVDGSVLSARWLQLRWTIVGDGTEVLSLDHLCYGVHAPVSMEQLFDVDTSDWEAAEGGGRIVPTRLLQVVDISLTLQNVGAGWSWDLRTKDPPTIRIYDGDGDESDAVVDVTLRGVAA